MRSLLDFFIKKSLFGDILTIAVIGIGIGAAFLIRRETFPNINFDVINITTVFSGATPEDVEKLITNPLEQDLKEVDGIKRLQSVSVENQSIITGILDPDQTTEEQGKSDFKDVVDRFTELPVDAEDPIVTAIKSKNAPVIEVALSGDLKPLDLRRAALDLEEEIERIPGVARVVHRGLRDLEIRVEPDLRKLASYRLSLDEVVAALRRQNINVPGGIVEALASDSRGVEKFVRTTGEFRTLEDVKRTVIRANDLGKPVRVGDVAEVRFELAREAVLTRTDGKPSLALTVLKKEKSDVIDLVSELKSRMPEIQKVLPAGVSLAFVNDMSEYVSRRLSVLTGNLTIGLLLVIFMLPFLIPFRFSLLIALGEPFAFLGTILVLHLCGFSINLLSMIGLIIVAGILVDDSIVVVENAVRLVEKGMEPKKAALEGTLQIVGPVTASVLTTSMAFLPMLFMSGIFGKFIQFIPIAVLTALAVSLFETFFILPGHVANWIKVRPTNSATPLPRSSWVGRALQTSRSFWETAVVPRYLRILHVLVGRRYVVLFAVLVLFIGSLTLAAKGMRFVLFPPDGIDIFYIRTEAPTATGLERHTKLLLPIEAAVAKLPATELKNYTTTVGLVQQDPNDPNSRRGSEFAQIVVYLTEENKRERSAAEIIEGLRTAIGNQPELRSVQFAKVNAGPPTGKPVSIGVRGKEYKEINAAAADVKAILSKVAGVTDISDNYTLGKEELIVNVNAAEAAAAGLSVAAVGNTVRAAYEGIVATTVRELDEEIDVRVSLGAEQRANAAVLSRISIPNASGSLIPLAQVADISSQRGVAIIGHEDNARQVVVSAEVDVAKVSSLEANQAVRKEVAALKKAHPEITFDFGGEDEDTQESLRSLLRAFAVAIIGIFLILVLTFGSLSQPFVVLLTVPLGIIAVIWAFFLHQMPLSFMGMLGIIALSGVIVNNAIVFVDFVNQRRKEGLDRFASIFDAAGSRLRPIFLTTFTTVVGVLPTAYGIGGLDKFVVPIALALGWGIAFGSVLTAFVFPAAIAALDDLVEFSERRGWVGKH